MQRCAISGVVNYFSDEDPYLSVGSIVEVRKSGVFHWRCYADGEPASGVAPDLRTAERQIERRLGAPVSRSSRGAGPGSNVGFRLSA